MCVCGLLTRLFVNIFNLQIVAGPTTKMTGFLFSIELGVKSILTFKWRSTFFRSPLFLETEIQS